MHAVFLVLAGLACTGHTRRVQTTSERVQETPEHGSQNPSEALAALMQSSHPAAAFSSSPSHLASGSATASRVQKPSMMARRARAKAKKAAPKRKAPKSGKFDVASMAGITGDTTNLVGRSDDSWLSVFDPNGLGYFDPAGFTLDASPATIRVYREAELKHGRVAMLAALGFVVGEKFHPLFGGSLDGPSLLLPKDPALLDQISVVGWGGIGLTILLLEVTSALTVFRPDGTGSWGPPADQAAGDLFAPFGTTFDPLGLKPKDAAELKVMQTKELNNGRLAMLAIMGMVLQEWKTGEPLFQ